MTVTVVNGASAPVNTYQDATGNPAQNHLVYAANAGVWWHFQPNSANDVAGVPGTHKVSAYYSSSGDPGAGTWTYYGDSPNINATTGTGTNSSNLGLFHNGRSLGCFYWNNSSGSNKDVCHLAASIYGPPGTGTVGGTQNNGVTGNMRAVLGASSVTWGGVGYQTTTSWNYVDQQIQAGIAMNRGTDGWVHMGCVTLNPDLDASIIASFDADTSDTWTVGGNGTGTVASTKVVTAMSTQAGLAVGYGISADNNAVLVSELAAVLSIDSSTQVTIKGANNFSGSGTVALGWSNFSIGTRANTTIDASMVHQSCCYDFAPLAGGNMLAVYDDGQDSPNNMSNMRYVKGSGAHSGGFWPQTTTGGDGAVFATSLIIANNNWCLQRVSSSSIYAIRSTTTATTLQSRVYSTAGNTWSATTNQPPVMTGKTILDGGGVAGDTDGTDFWIAVIDSTDSAIKWTKFTVSSGTWSAWATLVTVGSTAKYLTASYGNGYLGFVWTEKNADNTHYDTKAASLSVGAHAGGPSTALLGPPNLGPNAHETPHAYTPSTL